MRNHTTTQSISCACLVAASLTLGSCGPDTGTTGPSYSAQYCNVDSDCTKPNYCIMGTCRPLGQVGAACKIDVDCIEGLACPAGVCSFAGKIGAPCKSWKHCEAPLACWNGMCSSCTVSGMYSNIGAACCEDLNCNSGLNPPLYCILGTCRPVGGAGCSCGIDEDCGSLVCENGYCLGGGQCWEMGGVSPVPLSGSTGTGTIGTACQSWQDCVAPLACDTGKCANCTVSGYNLPVGSKCCDDSNCLEGYYCILSVCLPPGQPGAACGVHNDCASNSCYNGTCQ